MAKVKVILGLATFFILLSCKSVPTDDLTITPIIEKSLPSVEYSTSTLSVSPTLLATRVYIPTITSTITSTPTATPSPAPKYRYQSLTIEPSIPDDYEIEGVLVLDGLDEDFLLDLATSLKVPLPISTNESQTDLPDWTWPAVSPDRKWLVYNQISGDPPTYQLQVITANGHQQPILKRQPEWVHIIGWLDNDRVTLVKPFFEEVGTIAIFNPFTNEWKEIAPTFPIRTSNGELSGGGWSAPYTSFIFYDPTFTQSVYLRFIRDQNRETYELWDVQSKSILWEMSGCLFAYKPIWDPKGERFAVAYVFFPEQSNFNDDDRIANLSVIERDGQESLVINNIYGASTWSPDGGYIATKWHGPTKYANWGLKNSLAIVNVYTKETIIFSVSNHSHYPVWSPDGRYIAVDEVLVAGDIPSESKTRVIIVDLIENRAFEVASDARVRGWMVSEP